jgi:phosphatidylglycerophosphate synthase
MAEALVILSRPASDAGWPLVRVAGLPAIERNLMALRSVGIERAIVACGETEHTAVAAHFARRTPDARLPEVAVTRLDASPATGGAMPVLDGAFVYHPERLRGMVVAVQEGMPHTEPRRRSAPAHAEQAAWYCEEIATAPGRRRARRAIRESLRKPSDGWFARTIDRSASLAISSLLAPLPVHPNVITVGTLVVGVAAGLLAARGTYASFAAAGVMFLLASVLDGVDGEIARMKFQGSNAGQWLDTVCDDLTNVIYLSGVTLGTWRAVASPWLLWSGVAAVALDLVTVSFLYWQLMTRVNARTLLAFEETILAPALEQPGMAGLVARLQPFVKRDIYAPLFLAFALAGAAWVALPATAVALAITLAFLLRDLARQGSAGARLGPA